ncbi:biogenesis of lysosome-related organelles complex 1 subunit 3 [Neocloeon triangulifer]|uniref:biogenesis of lysosome-related organelles complex 1 subunit 3 n=1 Tax=Neocloeon triangulifer TaxID=2078957 RepID=UPI00286EDF9F|nr:biogenesis of lysosome-related organelles complex 1 subunit 3 [Neocloeon triangulifer]XP_059486003.1 biogenesis of lysosome-related organelles complex 1 subunit 3 [Neocloeon triangulifer]
MSLTVGEAPETESEEEIDTECPQKEKVKTKTADELNLRNITPASPAASGRIVAGEAPESDDEIEEMGSPCSTPVSQQKLDGTATVGPKEEVKYKSLLHKKLRSTNVHLRRGVNDIVHYNINQAARDLNFADQQLLKSQGVLQDTSSQLRLLGANLTQLNEMLQIITSPFLPNIQIPEENM